MDLSNNEFGFKILDENLKIATSGPENISYLDETGLEPNTEYSNRKIVAFNDRGQSSVSTLSVLPAIKTLPSDEEKETRSPQETESQSPVPEVESQVPETGGPVPPSESELRAQIQELQQKIIDLLKQLIQLLQEQISAAQASLFRAFGIFSSWLGARF